VVVLISYVDDGTIIVQSDTWGKNLVKLKSAYKIVFELTQSMGLVLKHSKSEGFHFSWKHSDSNPDINLGYAPYTGATPLHPGTTWQYLGFFFHCALTFREHVKHYTNKALTTVRAMLALGNSVHWTLTLSMGSTNLACAPRIYTMGALSMTLCPLCPKQTRITWPTRSTCFTAVWMWPPTPHSTSALSEMCLHLPYPSSQSWLSTSGMRGTSMTTGQHLVLLCLMTLNCKQSQMASVRPTMLVWKTYIMYMSSPTL
jgi:hypothetical protein